MARKPILVVDDSSLTRGMVREMLESEGFEVIEKADGAETIQYLVSDPAVEPSLILLDLQMPNMSGWEFVRIVNSYHRLARIPVIVLSGHEPTGIPKGTIAGFIPKPLDREKLLALVRSSSAESES